MKKTSKKEKKLGMLTQNDKITTSNNEGVQKNKQKTFEVLGWT
jgi:hypothetical protein